jgi:hypothetical protein
LRDEFANYRQLQQGLLEGVDAGFGGEQDIEMDGDALSLNPLQPPFAKGRICAW